MAESAFDIAMKFVMEGKIPVPAESTLDVPKDDDLMKDFIPITDYNYYSNFFEVESFDFAMNVVPEDSGSGNLSRGAIAQSGFAHQLGPGASPGRPGTPAGPGAAKRGDPFLRWRSATEQQARDMKFELSFDSFRFTRVIDGASPLFFQYCSRQTPFESAAIVKRVSMGKYGGVLRQSFAFMRIDFTEVLLKSVKWSDGGLVTEACEFVCSSLSFQYRQQQADGNLDAPNVATVWDRKRDSDRKRKVVR